MSDPRADADYGLRWGKSHGERRWWVDLGDGAFAYFSSHDDAEAEYLRTYVRGTRAS